MIENIFWCCSFHCGLFGAPAAPHPIIMEEVLTMGKINHTHEGDPEKT